MLPIRTRWFAGVMRWFRADAVLAVGCAVLMAMGAGCQQSSGGGGGATVDEGGDDDGPPLIGEPPTAQATSSVYGYVFPDDEVTLSGSGSDPDQGEEDPDPVLRWFQVAGTEVDLAGADTPEASFTLPANAVPGEMLGFELRVTDADGNTTSDWVYLFVPRGEAVLLAAASGPGDAVPAGTEVTLSSTGSLNIPEESAIYQWRQLEGPEVELEGADTPTATFLAPDPGDDEAVLTFRLTLKNGELADEALVEVTIVPADGAGPEPGDEEPSDGDPAAGEAAYADAGCGNCHGADGSGEPNLQGPGRLPDLEERFGDGGDHFGTALTDDQIVDVAAWLATLGADAEEGDGADEGEEPDGQGGPCDLPGADATEGETAYAANTCGGCHGADASGGSGPAMHGGDFTAALEERFLPEGTAHLGATLTEDEVRDIACWFSNLEP